MSSGDPPSPNRRARANPSLPEAAASLASGDVPAPAANRPVPSKVDTSVAGDPKNSTQPASQVSPAPKLETLGRYTILGELGRGGMGLVYLAEDTVLKRKVALKIPHFEPHKQEQMRDRFIREAQLAAQLTHRNICQVYDVGVIDDQLVMAMEYIDGRDLTAFTKPDKLLNARSAVSLIKKIAQAIDVAHKKGLIHRDLKPSNIMLAQSDTTNKMIEPKVMDFGLAKSLDSTGKQLTHSGMIVGTPCYMSKEQWSGKDGNLGPATDVFSLGVILYELLTGRLPYEEDEGEPATAWFVKLVTKEQIRPSVRKPGLDADLEAIVMKSIAKEVADRYATMADFAAALDKWTKSGTSTGKTVMVPGSDLDAFLAIVPPNSRPATAIRRQGGKLPGWVTWMIGTALLMLGMACWFAFASKSDRTVDGNGATTSPAAQSGASNVEAINRLVEHPNQDRWTSLFNGTDVSQWSTLGPFSVDNKLLVSSGIRGNAITRKEYSDFELELEWRVVRGGNSGVYYRSDPTSEGLKVGNEFSIADDASYDPSVMTPERKTGGLWGVIPPKTTAANPVGEWNKIRIICQGTKVEHWLNGVNVVRYDTASNEFLKAIAVSSITIGKEEIGRRQRGYIILQSHTGEAAFRNIRIRELPPSVAVTPEIAMAGTNANDSREITLPNDAKQSKLKTENMMDENSLPVGQWIDLLAMVKLPEHAIMGKWELEPKLERIVGAPGATARFMVPVIVSGSYEVIASYTRYAGTDATALILPVGSSSCMVIVDGNVGRISGLIEVDKKANFDLLSTTAAIRQEKPFDNDSTHTLHASVTFSNDSVHVNGAIDKKTFVKWQGQPSQLSLPLGMLNPNPHAIGFLQMNSGVIVRELKLRLKEEGKGYRLGNDWKNSLYPVIDQPTPEVLKLFPDDDWCIWNGKRYLMSDKPMPLSESQRLAEQIGGRLVTISSDAEQSFLSSTSKNRYYWTAGWCNVDRKDWRDERNRPLKYLKWGGDEPTNHFGREFWLAMRPDGMVADFPTDHDWPHACIEWGEEYPEDVQNISQLGLNGRKAGDSREITLPGNVKLKQLWCPPGTFMMGTPGETDDESPVEVTLTQGFWAAETETTQEQWTALMGAASMPWSTQASVKEGQNYPATYIRHGVNANETIAPDSATDFCEKLTEVEGKAGRIPAGWRYALPTEAQWEYMCRAGTKTEYSFGDSDTSLEQYAWINKNSIDAGEPYAHAVGMKKANPWGFFDLHGNVSEWCRDGYVEKLPGGSDPFVSPVGVESRVNRGGNWRKKALWCRSAHRLDGLPSSRHDLGFRVALVAGTSSELSTVSVPDEDATTNFPAGKRLALTSQSIPFRWCPAGTFSRGEGGTGPEATLTHGFWMGETEVTMDQWKTLMQNAPWVAAKREAMDEPNNPAVWISYTDVLAYCEKMTTAERAAGRLPVGWKYTLPTGAQWEYACRAGTSTRFSFGDDGSQLGEYGWYSKNAKDEGEWYGHAVAQKKPNPWGLYDMHGNVWEWCLDWHHDTLPGGRDPVDSVAGNDRVFWGGGWYYEDWSCTTFSRLGYPPYGLNPHIGFRLAIVKE